MLSLFTLLYTVFVYGTAAIFLFALLAKILMYARTPSPLQIVLAPAPTTALGAAFRVAGEVVLFKSLFKGNKWTWVGSYLFHGAFLLVILRHLRYFVYPVPHWVLEIQTLGIYAGYLLPLSILYLWFRRTTVTRILFISSLADYFVLLLLLAIAFTGFLLSYSAGPFLVDIKAFLLGLVTLHPQEMPPEPLFLLHFTLVLILLVYFPFSKLVHSCGLFFSPTLSQVDNGWKKRHINPWDGKRDG